MVNRLFRDIATLAGVVAIAVAIRLFVASVYAIPSESMVPTLDTGDYLLVAKWPYGWSGDGGPLARHLWSGRLAAKTPARGDVAVFKAPPSARMDYVKRVIALPGDQVALVRGTVILNGRPLPRRRMADLYLAETPNSPCRPEPGADIARVAHDGGTACRYRRWRETLPDGRHYTTLDLGNSEADDFGPVIVPAGRMFVLGDNRDRSADSRFPAHDGGGVGMVPQDALVGRPILLIASVDGSARLDDPASWWRALRGARFLRPL